MSSVTALQQHNLAQSAVGKHLQHSIELVMAAVQCFKAAVVCHPTCNNSCRDDQQNASPVLIAEEIAPSDATQAPIVLQSLIAHVAVASSCGEQRHRVAQPVHLQARELQQTGRPACFFAAAVLSQLLQMLSQLLELWQQVKGALTRECHNRDTS